MRRGLILSLSLICFGGSAFAQFDREAQPEGATGSASREVVRAERHMVAAAHPLAAQAGLEILRAGGSAADAVVTIQTVLGLVEPQSSGIGGGAFLLWYDAAAGEITTFDGRETAPSAATGELFFDADGEPLPFFEAVVGGRSVGVPGVPRLLESVHQRFGKLAWEDVLAPAVTLAEQGFEVTPRLHGLLQAELGRLDRDPASTEYFFGPDGLPRPVGERMANPEYADTLRTLASEGADGFYSGPVAEAIVAAVRDHPENPGLLTLEDMAAYRVVERPAVCVVYREEHDICGMGSPSSGGLTIGQIMGVLTHFDLSGGPEDAGSWQLIGDASRLAFADRNRYMADSDFVSMPQGLVDPAYLSQRMRLIEPGRALAQDAVTAGDPPWDRTELRLDGLEYDRPATTHFVVVDDEGNIASMTSSIESAFGARIMAAGFLLNNQLTDFAFSPESAGEAVANRVEPGKRPRSSMSPTIVLRDGTPVYALGSPGGASIIPYVARTLVALIDWDMDIQQAIDLPHLVNTSGTYALEGGTAAEEMAAPLQAMGYETAVRDLNSGLHGIAIGPEGLEGGADPRREGVALGD